MKRGLYNDAVRVLLSEIRGQPESQCGQSYLMLAESYYMLKEYAKARPYFVRANRHLEEARGKVVAEYRLACIAYRMGDTAGALDRISGFVKKHPSDRRSGTLLLFKMKLLARRGKEAQPQIEAIHKRIHDNRRTFRYTAAVAADKILTDFYLQHGQAEKAKERYRSIVHRFRNVIAEYAKEKRPVSPGLKQAHDDAAMQLGIMSLKAKRFDDAVRWLENVKYDTELKRKARLLLAQVAYQKRDLDRAIQYLTHEGFIDTIPPGPLRSDMYLLLGLCEKSKPNPNLSRVVEYLLKVKPGAKGYFQAQVGLGDLCRERGFWDRAIKAYENAVPSPKYESHVLFYLGRSYMEQAGLTVDGAKKDALYRKAAKRLSQLTTKYPSARLAKQASKSIDFLLGKGYDVRVATSDAEMVQRWEQNARRKPGSVEAARSLINLARLHHKTVMDEKMERAIRAPNYLACASACDRLLDARVYTGKGFPPDQWKDIRVEALYYRGLSHVVSAGPSTKDTKVKMPPTYLKAPDLERAIGDLSQAKGLVDPTRLDLVKGIELGLLEAMFKSDKEEYRQKARARFAELVDEYGTDVRFQRLAMDLAEWYRRQGRYAEAAREYRGIAERGANLSQDALLKALFMAGKLYGKAAYEARHKPGKTRYGIYIYPKEVFKLADLLRAHRPFQKKIRVKWPEGAKSITAEEALTIVSKASGIPFVWSPQQRPDSVAGHLRFKRLRSLESLGDTVEGFLRQILDLKTHRLTFDIGITGGKPTIEPKPADPEEPGRTGPSKTIEIYDVRRWTKRYRPLARDYGSWQHVHNGPAMLFHVVRRIEELSGTKVLWARGVEKGYVLAAEYDAIPGVDRHRGCSCAEALAKLLDPLDLRFKIVARDRSAELYEEAKNCFNEIRQVDPKSSYGEKSLFLLALNFYHQEDYERMKIVLKEYLRLFDSPNHQHHHEACFWVGWVFEHEGRHRYACHYYNRAAEECLVIFKPAPDEKRLSRKELKAQLSYDTRFALEEPVDGALENYALGREFLDFIRLNTNVAVRLDASAVGIDAAINRKPFTQVPVFDILCDVLDELGLSFRVENVNKRVAERAYYRMASAYKKDGLMEQALASCNVLLSRFPNTSRRRDAYKLKLEIYKGLKDYRSVLATLEELKRELGDQIEGYKIDFEMAWICFDLCRYNDAVERFKSSLAAAKDPKERIKIRDGYARALFRKGDLEEALHQYRTLSKEEPEPLRAFVDMLMVWYLERTTGKDITKELPAEALKLIRWYEDLSEGQQSRLPTSTLAGVTWIYYVVALADLEHARTETALKEVLEKLAAAANSPDDWLAADAIYRSGIIHMKARRFREAKEAFEYLLFSTKSAEAEVRATYALGLCLQGLGAPAQARKRFDQVLRRFPDSSYAYKIQAKRREAPKPETKNDE